MGLGITANLQNVNAMARSWRGVGAAMQQANRLCGAGAPGLTRRAFYLTTGRQLVRACHQRAKKESAPPSPEAHKFHDIKPFNLGMGKQL
ncbi:hypothetical protein [Ralstonia psammae]|uniref:hypothetical protein n=1 Tax=Ralstonia psammae TaxID=3058598 RepID=UPI00292E70B5|nr:hypothetical protein [Ralstonia sp. LMG 19083]